MTVLALARDPAPPSHPLSDIFVLHARSLRAGTSLESTARFGDDVWPLGPILHQDHMRNLILDFTTLPARWQTLGKELSYALLSAPLPPGEARLDPVTIREIFTELKRFFAWLDSRPGRPLATLSAMAPADLLDYQRHLRALLPGSNSRSRARAAVRRFWRYRNNLISDRLAFDPLRVDGWGEPNQAPNIENATDRIPEAVFGPLLAWALRFVDDFAVDILAGDERWRQLRGNEGRMLAGHASAALQQLVQEHLRDQRPLPGYAGRPNLANLAATIGCSRRYLQRHRDEIAAVAETVGLTPAGLIDVPITGRLDGQAWIEGIATMHKGTRHGLGTLARLLQAACYIVIAFLSGMRDSEIKHLRRGCLSTQYDADGIAYRWKLHGLAFKGEQDPTGTPATWVVGRPVARAIEVLQRLQPETELLFARLPHGPGNGPATKARNAVLVSSTTNKQLNEFIDWINTYCAEHQRDDTIPTVNKRAWRLKSSQFRRTLAWFIARRPGGSIAGAIQYRHLSIQMFEGYAGTSDSGFRAEVESEQALSRGEHLLAMIDAHEHENLAGPAAVEAERRLTAFADQPGFPGTVVTDRRRFLRIIAKHDPAVYPGDYVTCVFDPDTKGTRRIQEAIRDLDARHLISVRDRGGLPSVLTIREESGSGDPYTP
ncbi:MAG: hypothetical protein QOH97_3275, partial [Actinoplanes sp.]|nr:hypothetical protein [Actinoplanes sp.]